MCYLMIDVGSIDVLKDGKFENVKTRVNNRLMLKNRQWLIPKGYWVPYYRTEDTCGIVLNVLRNNHTSIAGLSSKYLRVPDNECGRYKNVQLTSGLWNGILSFEMEIAYLRQMSCYGVSYEKQADIVEQLYLYDDLDNYMNGGMNNNTMFSDVASADEDTKKTIGVWKRMLEDNEPELSVFYFMDATSFVANITDWGRPRKELLLPKKDFVLYYNAKDKFRYIQEMMFPDSLTRFLKSPGTISLLESIFTCAYNLELL